MWTIPEQLIISLFVPDMRGLGLDCEEFGEMSEKSLVWRSKPSLKRTWCQRWKRVTYIQLLSTRMLRPSHFESFVERWISSLPDSLVHRFPRLEDENQQMIRDIYTHISVKESHNANQLTLFSKTSKESSQVKPEMVSRYSSMSSETWKKEVIAQRGEYSQRLKLVRPINESEYLSWPTATTSDVRDGKYLRERTRQWMAEGKVKGIILNQATENEECQELYKKRAMWPTAKLSDGEGGRIIPTELNEGGFRSLRKKSNQWFGAKLRDAVETYEEKNWPTPTLAETSGGKRTKQIKEGKWHNIQLREAIDLENEKNWPTPTSTERSGTNPKTGRGGGLSKEAKQWLTPTTTDMDRTEEGMKKRIEYRKSVGRKYVEGCLTEQIMNKEREESCSKKKDGRQSQDSSKKSGKSRESWGTPSASDWKGTPGANSKQKRITKQLTHPQRLNPNWVEQLMGLPFVGWTQIPTEWID